VQPTMFLSRRAALKSHIILACPSINGLSPHGEASWLTPCSRQDLPVPILPAHLCRGTNMPSRKKQWVFHLENWSVYAHAPPWWLQLQNASMDKLPSKMSQQCGALHLIDQHVCCEYLTHRSVSATARIWHQSPMLAGKESEWFSAKVAFPRS